MLKSHRCRWGLVLFVCFLVLQIQHPLSARGKLESARVRCWSWIGQSYLFLRNANFFRGRLSSEERFRIFFEADEREQLQILRTLESLLHLNLAKPSFTRLVAENLMGRTNFPESSLQKEIIEWLGMIAESSGVTSRVSEASANLIIKTLQVTMDPSIHSLAIRHLDVLLKSKILTEETYQNIAFALGHSFDETSRSELSATEFRVALTAIADLLNGPAVPERIKEPVIQHISSKALGLPAERKAVVQNIVAYVEPFSVHHEEVHATESLN